MIYIVMIRLMRRLAQNRRTWNPKTALTDLQTVSKELKKNICLQQVNLTVLEQLNLKEVEAKIQLAEIPEERSGA